MAGDQDYIDMSTSVKVVEDILHYSFKDKSLLEKALTHSSYMKAKSNERLEFLGDAVLSLVISNVVYLYYPEIEPGELSLIRAANISTENLARINVRHGLYKYVRHNVTTLDEKVKEFCEAVQQEEGTVVHGGAMKAPKILADVVEALVAAIFEDLQFDLKALWSVVKRLLEPLITLDRLQLQPQPVTMLFELCQKNGKQVDIEHSREGDQNIASIYIDGEFTVSASSDQKENAKLNAARAALEKLTHLSGKMNVNTIANCGIHGAKRKLHEVCCRKKWSTPIYSIAKEEGPAHARKFICSVTFEMENAKVAVNGEEKLRVRDAEGSAALTAIHGLLENNYI